MEAHYALDWLPLGLLKAFRCPPQRLGIPAVHLKYACDRVQKNGEGFDAFAERPFDAKHVTWSPVNGFTVSNGVESRRIEPSTYSEGASFLPLDAGGIHCYELCTKNLRGAPGRLD